MNLKNKHMTKLTEKELWRLIENATWKADHDYGKIYANSIKGLLDKLEAVRAK